MIKQVSAMKDLSLNLYSNGLETVVSLCLSVPLSSSEFHGFSRQVHELQSELNKEKEDAQRKINKFEEALK